MHLFIISCVDSSSWRWRTLYIGLEIHNQNISSLTPPSNRTTVFNINLLRGNLHGAVGYVKERGKGSISYPDVTTTRTGLVVVDIIKLKQTFFFSGKLLTHQQTWNLSCSPTDDPFINFASYGSQRLLNYTRSSFLRKKNDFKYIIKLIYMWEYNCVCYNILITFYMPVFIHLSFRFPWTERILWSINNSVSLSLLLLVKLLTFHLFHLWMVYQQNSTHHYPAPYNFLLHHHN